MYKQPHLFQHTLLPGVAVTFMRAKTTWNLGIGLDVKLSEAVQIISQLGMAKDVGAHNYRWSPPGIAENRYRLWF